MRKSTSLQGAFLFLRIAYRPPPLWSIRPSQGFWGTGGPRIYFKEQSLTHGGKRAKAIMRKCRLEIQDFVLGDKEIERSISGEQGNRYPPGRALYILWFP